MGSWSKLKMPWVVLYNGDHQVVIGDNTYIQVSRLEAKLTDNGKDAIEVTLQSKNVELLGGLGLEHGGFIEIAWGYRDSGLRSAIPYIIDDVTNTYSHDGLTTVITLTDFSSPFDINSGEAESFDGELTMVSKDGEEVSTKIETTPLEFIFGMMAENLKFYLVYNTKTYLIKDDVKVGNGFIPMSLSFSPSIYAAVPGLFSGVSYGQIGVDIETESHDKLSWMGDLPDSLVTWLTKKRTIDLSGKRHITVLENLLSIMPEGPWYINRRANIFTIHNRGGFSLYGGNSGTTGSGKVAHIFNFKSDHNTILSFKIKHDGKKLEENTESAVDTDETLRKVGSVQQYNNAILKLRDLYLALKMQQPTTPSSGASVIHDGYPSKPDDRVSTNISGKVNEGNVVSGGVGEPITLGDKINWGGFEITKEQYDIIQEYYSIANAEHKTAGVEMKNVYYQNENRVVHPEFKTTSGPNMNFDTTPRVSKISIGKATYTYFSQNEATGEHNVYVGKHYVQLQPGGDAFWESSNNFKERVFDTITATLIVKGDPSLVEGILVRLIGVGYDSGVYYVKEAKHVVNSSGGYKTELSLSRPPEGGMASTINNIINKAEDFSSNKLKEIHQWAVFLGIDTRYLYLAKEDPGEKLTFSKEIEDRYSSEVNTVINGQIKPLPFGSTTDGTAPGPSTETNGNAMNTWVERTQNKTTKAQIELADTKENE